MKIFTRERAIYGIILALITVVGSIYTAKLQASDQTTEALSAFKVETAKELGVIKGDVQTAKAINMEVSRRLENIEGSLQTLSSYILNKR